MAMATSRMSLDPPPSLIDLPLHALPARVADLMPAADAPVRRVSSESQTPGRASPAPRISRRTPVPFLLEAFPVPPSHIPGTPTTAMSSSLLNSPSLFASATNWLPPPSAGSSVTTNPVLPSDSIALPPCSKPVATPLAQNIPPPASAGSGMTTNSASPSDSTALSPCSPKPVATSLAQNPPPSSPPTGPLPPVPGPSTFMPELFTAHRALQTVSRSASPALSTTESLRSRPRKQHRPRLSLDVDEPTRRRGRQGSLSSLRNPIFPAGEQSEAIAEELVEESGVLHPPPSAASPSPPLFGSVAERKNHDRSRGDSPDILRSSLRRVAATPSAGPDGKLYVEDSIASMDMSDLNALKSDNEGEGDDQASRPFPRFPPIPRSQQSPNPLPSAPSYVHLPRQPSESSVCSMEVVTGSEDTTSECRAMSPEITHMITATPRPRKRSMPSRSRDPSTTRNRTESRLRSRRGSDAPSVPTSSQTIKAMSVTKATQRSGGDEGNRGGEDGGNDSDSSLDLHTPLPQLMLRHGMLSPHSKLLPHPDAEVARLSIMSSLSTSSHLSNASNLSLMSTTSTSSKHPKDARDTLRRRHRHRDGKMLKGGVGLTTGLGWSDSEDEDAPSQLTRRVSTLVLSRRASSSSVASYRSAPAHANPPTHPIARSISHSILREADEFESEHNPDEFGYSLRSSIARSLPSRSKPVSRVGSVRSNGSSLGRYSTYSNSSAVSAGHRARVGSASSIGPKPDGVDEHSTLMPGIREHDDGITPTRAAFQRSSSGSLNGGSAADPHTPSSTASSASLPFPATPESTEPIPPPQSVYNQDKVLPPLPLAVKGKYSSSSLGPRIHPTALQRPRTYSNTSSVSNAPTLGVPSAGPNARTTSPTSTPRPSLADRPPKVSISAGSPRPLNGPPRPSLTIPKSPLAPQSGLPRATTPSLSPSTNPGQGYAPRPLRLVSRSSSLPSPSSPANPLRPPQQAELTQTTTKALQPGELPSRPGQVLTYNRNVHDQLKLRSLSLNTAANRAPGPVVSPGGTQTLFVPTPTPATPTTPSSALSTPFTARSQSPMTTPSTSGESPRPKPRTGTGMMYRTNLTVGSVATSRIRVPSTVSR